MSKVSVVYDSLLKKLDNLFTDKQRIPFPYSLKDNPNGLVADGFGLMIESAQYTPFEYGSFVITRGFTLVLTREFIALDGDTNVCDDITKNLLEDIYEAQKMFYGADRMEIEEILDVKIGSVSGVELVTSGNKKFVYMQAQFNIDIQENL